MRRLETFILNEALTFLQRCHQRPEQLATAALLKFQRELDALDRRLSAQAVQTFAFDGNPVAVRAERLIELEQALAAERAAHAETRAQLTDTLAARDSDGPELIAQLRADFAITADQPLDALYDRIVQLKAAKEAAAHEGTLRGSAASASYGGGHAGADPGVADVGAAGASRGRRQTGR